MSPNIVGYAGDSLFASVALSQIMAMQERGLLCDNRASGRDRFAAFLDKLQEHRASFNYHPLPLSVVYVARDVDSRQFVAFKVDYEPKHGWRVMEMNYPDRSGWLCVIGSGRSRFLQEYSRYQKSPTHGTSRNIFHCFRSTLASGEADACGGAPQLVGLHRNPGQNGIEFGIISSGQRFIFGCEAGNLASYDGVKWINENFEECDGRSMKRLDSSRRRPDPFNRP